MSSRLYESVTEIVSVLGATTPLLIRILHLENPDVSIKDNACCLLTSCLPVTSYADFVSAKKVSESAVGAIEQEVIIKETHRKNLKVFIGYQFLECLTFLQYNIYLYYFKIKSSNTL